VGASQWRAFAMLMLASACRADVEGDWSGAVGADGADLWLEQKGALIEGDLCLDAGCTPLVDGYLDEGSLRLDYGCDDCPVPPTTLQLTVLDDRLEGEARLWSCECEADESCSCRAPAGFTRCAGRCGSRRTPARGSP
jgi:hypothetical protein